MWIVDGSKLTMVGYAKDYTMAHKHFTNLLESKDMAKILEGDIRTLNMPLKLTKWRRFFDFGPMMSNFFEKKWKEVKPMLPPKKEINLTSTEMEVFKALIQYPDSTDKEVAIASSSSRQTISRLKREFEKKGLIKTINMVDFSGLGFQLLYFFYLKYVSVNPSANIEKVQENIIGPDAFFAGNTATDLVMAGYCRDFKEVNDKHRIIKRTMEDAGISPSDWSFEILTTDSIRFLIRHNYNNLLPHL